MHVFQIDMRNSTKWNFTLKDYSKEVRVITLPWGQLGKDMKGVLKLWGKVSYL